MGLRTVLAACTCKATYKMLRLMKRGATSLPGKLALKIDPNYLHVMSAGVKTLVLTGTNGKTTSTHIVAQALENVGEKAFYNRSGANLIQGITTEFAMNSTITGKPKCKFAIIECDEGALKRVCKSLDPQVVVVSNIFRDQLDRYGEVMHTRENILNGLKNSPHATVCLNADCSLTTSLADDVPNDVVYYGVDCPIYPVRVPDLSDATHCVRCGAPYEYDYTTYAHLGGFRCTGCGYSRPECSVAVEEIVERGTNHCKLKVRINGESQVIDADVPATYEVYNCAAAITALTTFGIEKDKAFGAVAKFKHGFGRSEIFQLGDVTVRLMLMKNPAGCNQIINMLLNDPDSSMGIACVLNDQECDGTDVSWIYDAAWEYLCESKTEALCSGIRAEDMALRLKYAGMPAEGICIEKDFEALIDKLAAAGHDTTVVANYSSMLEFRAKIAARVGRAGFWEG